MTDAELVADRGADSFAEVYRRHARRVAAYLMRATGDAETAAAVVLRRPGRAPLEVRPIEGPTGSRDDFYVFVLAPDELSGRVNWIDRRGGEGRPGITPLPR